MLGPHHRQCNSDILPVAGPFIREELDRISSVILPELFFWYQVMIFQITPVNSAEDYVKPL